MRSQEKMLSILDLFDEGTIGLTFDEIHERLGYTRSTLYRYLQLLSAAGLLTSLPGIGYALGPRIIQLDYTIRNSDPLIHAARPAMKALVSQFTGVALLCRRYRQEVLCVHQESSADAIRSSYERGLGRPLLRGAASLAILAYLPAHRIGKLYAEMPEAFREAGLGDTLPAVRATLKAYRQVGWIATTGQVTSGVTGIAAPVFDGQNEVLGSLSLTLPNQNLPEKRLQEIGERVELCAGIISKSLLR